MKTRKTKAKRFLSLLLALLMIISTVPLSGMSAFAAESGDFEYTILGDGTVEITGYNGTASDLVIPSEIDGYRVTSIGYAAFKDNTDLVSVVIPDGVIKINYDGFSGCSSLKDVSIPNSVTTIEMGAFEKCTSLKSIKLPTNLNKIGEWAFSGCTSLSGIVIPDSVKTIGYGAFENCSSFKTITIPRNVTELNSLIFEGCTSLTEIAVSPENRRYIDIDGVVFSKDKKNLIIFPQGKGGEYSIPDGTAYIGNFIFDNNTKLEKINIPKTVVDLGSTPFQGCTALKDISVDANNPNYSSDKGALLTKDKTIIIDYPDAKTGSYNIPNTVKRIENYAFEKADLDRVVIPESVKEIGYSAFAYCTSLADIDIADNVESIEAKAFYKTAYYENQDNWENGIFYLGNYLLDVQDYTIGSIDSNSMIGRISAPINIKEGTKVIADSAFERTFIESDSNVDIIIPNSVITIGDNAFASLTIFSTDFLINVTVPSSVKNMGEDVFKTDFKISGIPFVAHSSLGSVTFLGDVANVDSGMFSKCNSLKTIEFKGNVGNITDSAFSSLSSLENISFSGTVGEIGSSVFSSCSSLKNVVLPNNLTNIPDYMFNGCTSLETITIPAGVEKIGNYAFANCSSLSDITLPDGVTYIGQSSLDNTAYYNDPSNWKNGELYVDDYLIKISNELSGKYEVKDNVKAIAADVFTNCANLTEIVLPDNMLVLPDSFFAGCSSLKKITIPRSVSEIGAYAFNGCSSLKEIVIPNGVSSLGWSVFEDCTFLTNVIIPDSVTGIGGRAFANCSSLKEINIPNSVTSIGSEAFSGCTALDNVTIPESVTYLGSDALVGTAYYNNLSNWNNGILYLDNCLVSVSEDFEGVCSIDNDVRVIADGVFSNNDKITGIDLPDNMQIIPEYMFTMCDSLKTIKIPVGVKEIREEAFDGCSSLETIILPETLESIKDLAFANCESLTSVAIPESVTDIGYYAFGYTGNPAMGTDRIPDFTIYGYAGTAAETYAKENGFAFIALDKKVDSATGISVAEKELNIIPDGAQLKTEKLSAEENKIVFDISLVKNGIAVQPNGEVTVKIPVPEGMDTSLLKIYREESNGKYTDMKAYFANGYMIFTTDHFSKYVLTTEEPSSALPGDINGDGKVTAIDARWVLQIAAGTREVTEAERKSVDLNKDGKVTAIDARWVLQAAAGTRVI